MEFFGKDGALAPFLLAPLLLSNVNLDIPDLAIIGEPVAVVTCVLFLLVPLNKPVPLERLLVDILHLQARVYFHHQNILTSAKVHFATLLGILGLLALSEFLEHVDFHLIAPEG